MVTIVHSGVEVRKMDPHGRLLLPSGWRKAEVGPDRRLYVVKRRGYLKVIPKRAVDLTEHFDKVDLGVAAVGAWKEFEGRFRGG